MTFIYVNFFVQNSNIIYLYKFKETKIIKNTYDLLSQLIQQYIYIYGHTHIIIFLTFFLFYKKSFLKCTSPN